MKCNGMKSRVLIWIGLLFCAGEILCLAQPEDLRQRLLLDTANRYFMANNADSALLYYRQVIEVITSGRQGERECPVDAVTALNRSGIIYMNQGNYYRAYRCLIDALSLCETYGIVSEQPRIYNNMGNVYYHFKKYDIAEEYYRRALALCADSARAGYYNNLGQALSEMGEADSAFFYFERSLQACRRYDNDRLFALYNSMASLYRKEQQFDSAFHYYRLSSVESLKNNKIEHEAQNLSDLGRLFLQQGQLDSALFYVGESDRLARENGFLKVMVENALIWSQAEELRGNTEGAFGYYKRYAGLRDSVFNAGTFGDISQLQRSYEKDKTNRQIEQLVVKQREKERTIAITLCVLAVVCIALLYIYLQNRKLDKAYSALVEKNLEIKRYEEKEKEKKTDAGYGVHDELFDRILAAMEDTAMICEPDFSIDKLATAVRSNHTYVSRAIKNATDKSFRQFLNGYRVREAQRIFSEPEAARYTIESVALRVGFKSRNAFHDVFKDQTGVSPNFYLKSLRERLNG